MITKALIDYGVSGLYSILIQALLYSSDFWYKTSKVSRESPSTLFMCGLSKLMLIQFWSKCHINTINTYGYRSLKRKTTEPCHQQTSGVEIPTSAEWWTPQKWLPINKLHLNYGLWPPLMAIWHSQHCHFPGQQSTNLACKWAFNFTRASEHVEAT